MIIVTSRLILICDTKRYGEEVHCGSAACGHSGLGRDGYGADVRHARLARASGREMAEQKATHHHAMPAGHPCCPGIGKTENADLLEFAAGSPPCQDEHRCCFRQGPLSVPAPLSAGRRLSSDIAPAEIAELSPASAESYVSLATAVAPGLPPSLLGMILRV